MRFAASRGQHASLYAHDNRTRQQSCSHYTAIRNQRFKKRTELRTHEQPLVAEHRGGTDSRSNRPQPHPPHTHTRYLSSPAAATLHGKTHGFVLRFSSQHRPHATFMQPLHCDLQRESRVWCDVNSHTTLHWVKIIHNSANCFPTSFDNIHVSYIFKEVQGSC